MAIENGTQNAELGYILDPAFQIEGLNGKPVVGGWICIYEAGTNNKYISYENFDGAQNPFKIPLKADGRAVILGDPSRTYDIYAYDSYGNQLFSRLNVQCNVPGNISITGADTYLRNTDGTLDVSLQTSSNNRRVYTVNTHNKVLDVQEPLYFAENSNTATVIGFSGDNYATSADLASKLDVSKLEYNNNGEISAYDGSAFAGGQGGAGDPEVNYIVHSNSATWNDVSAKLDTTSFSTVSGSFLTAVPDTYLQNTDLTVVDNKITEISGVPLSASDEIVNHDNTLSGNGTVASPLGVMLSATNDANVNNIVVTAALPDTPNSNTLYLIPEA